MKFAAWMLLVLPLAACGSPWKPTPLTGGYQIMVMNSNEVYIAESDNELILGPKIERIGISTGFVVVDCGQDQVVVNGFANTVGFNLIDVRTGEVKKALTASQVELELRSRHLPMPEMRPLASYLP